jgi:dihydroorotate dehydrogenase
MLFKLTEQALQNSASRQESAYNLGSLPPYVFLPMLYALTRPALFALDPESAHHVTLSLIGCAARLGVLPHLFPKISQPVQCMGLVFDNPVGLAAGLDKNGEYIDALAALGFGSIEIGTITPRAQAGNPKPRLFRLPQANAIINRMGYNNHGVDALVENVITVNISSPNTQGLRSLQSGDALSALLETLKNRQLQLQIQHGRYVPLVLKVAPDLESSDVEFISQQLLNFGIDGLIATNTTLARVGVESLPFGNEAGGLSGQPVFDRSTAILTEFAAHLGGKIPLIGVGGICLGGEAKAKIEAGASLVQIYSGLIYRGPNLINECVRALA